MKKLFLFLTGFIFLHFLNAQTVTDSLLIENHYRIFTYNIPQYTTDNASLVFVMHGSGGNGKDFMKYGASLEAIAAKEKIVIVYPTGYKNYWNECRKNATSEANKLNINEEAFFTAMHHYFINKHKVKKDLFFAIGLSGGGHMAYKLAMTMPDKCKAISAVVASVPEDIANDCEQIKKPVAVMISNGTMDNLNKYNGGDIIINNSNWGPLMSSENSFTYWAKLAGYKGKPTVKNLPDTDTSNNQTITQYTYKKKNKPEVTLLEVKGGEHTFPKDIDIFTTSWYFFKREMERLKL